MSPPLGPPSRHRTNSGSTTTLSSSTSNSRVRSQSRRLSTQSRRKSMTTESGYSMYSVDGSSDWEGEEGREMRDMPSKRRNKKDEPMSPIVVVLYVTAAYLIFQLLTRSDDLEILSHLPPTSSLRSASNPFNLPGLSGSNLHSDLTGHHNPYNTPGYSYHLPHIPSPIAKTAPGDDSPTSFIRLLLGILFYPFYLVLNLIAIPIPYILQVLSHLMVILITLLSPITATIRLIFSTFILTPLSILRSVINAFYPIYTFVGGIIGFGCVMGLGTAYIGKIGLDLLLGRRKSSSPSTHTRSKTRNGHTSSSKSRSKVSSSSSSKRKELRGDTDYYPSRSVKSSNVERPIREEGRGEREVVILPEEDYRGESRSTAKSPQVIGTRRRTYGFEQR